MPSLSAPLAAPAAVPSLRSSLLILLLPSFFLLSSFPAPVAASLSQATSHYFDGQFTTSTQSTNASIDAWAWANQNGPWRFYINPASVGSSLGRNKTSDWYSVSASFKSPYIAQSSVGVRIVLREKWNNYLRTEMVADPAFTASVPFTTSYSIRFSMKIDPNYPLTSTANHQLVFFESHPFDLIYGPLPGQSGDYAKLRFLIGGQQASNVVYEISAAAGTWMNFAVQMFATNKTIALWYSTNGDELSQVVAPTSASDFSNTELHFGGLVMATSLSQDEVIFYDGITIDAIDTLVSSSSSPSPTPSLSFGASPSTTASPSSSPSASITLSSPSPSTNAGNSNSSAGNISTPHEMNILALLLFSFLLFLN